MSTINGFGTRYLGQSALQSDGSYITTKWMCFVFPAIPLGSYRVWPKSNKSHLLGMYSSSTFQASPAPLHWPHVFKLYGIYFALYLLIVIGDRIGSGTWHFS